MILIRKLGKGRVSHMEKFNWKLMIEKGTYIFSLWYIFIFFDFNVALDLICKICVSFDMYSKFEIYIINRKLLKSEIEQC